MGGKERVTCKLKKKKENREMYIEILNFKKSNGFPAMKYDSHIMYLEIMGKKGSFFFLSFLCKSQRMSRDNIFLNQ